MYLKLALLSFVIFMGNIFLGSFWGITLVGDVGELIMLLITAVLFVIAILQAERLAQSNNDHQ